MESGEGESELLSAIQKNLIESGLAQGLCTDWLPAALSRKDRSRSGAGSLRHLSQVLPMGPLGMLVLVWSGSLLVT